MSVEIEESLRSWMASRQAQRERIAEQGAERFFAALGPAAVPSSAQIERASAAAREAVFAALTADAVLDNLPRPPASAGAREALRGSWLALSPPWTLPDPPVAKGLPQSRLAIAAALGSLLGMLVLGTLLHWTLDLRGTGLLLGAPLGAAGALVAVGRLTESQALRRAIAASLGVAGLAELAAVAALGLGAIWLRLAGLGLLRRILVYAGVVGLLAFTRDPVRADATAYRRLIEDAIRNRVDYGNLLLGSLSLGQVEHPSVLLLDKAMARAIRDLHESDIQALPAAADSVLLEARRLGLEGLGTPARFAAPAAPERSRLRWGAELAERYRPFGLIEEGDPVIVEDEPVVQNGVVLEKGRVRKQHR